MVLQQLGSAPPDTTLETADCKGRVLQENKPSGQQFSPVGRDAFGSHVRSFVLCPCNVSLSLPLSFDRRSPFVV